MQPIDWLLRPLVERIVRLEANLRRAPVLRWGTVTSMSPLRVQLDADPEPLVGEPSIAAPIASVGQRVLCAIQDRRVTVLGSKQQGPTAFALKSQLNAWNAIDGTHAWVTAEGREYVRRGGTWRRVPIVLSGSVVITPDSGGVQKTATVTFPSGYFTTAPAISVAIRGNINTTGTFAVSAPIVTASSATIALVRANTVATSIDWTAVES